MLAPTPTRVNATFAAPLTASTGVRHGDGTIKRPTVADVKVENGIIKVSDLEIQDPKAAAVLAEYPEARWAEITRRAIKIGLGYLRGGGQD